MVVQVPIFYAMEWVAVPVLKFMKWLYALVGNYGVAIMVLTIVTKLLFFPLSVKSMKSMKARRRRYHRLVVHSHVR
jgi:membrane protein insertase Oxa1/YidC/SpoIIIJ